MAVIGGIVFGVYKLIDLSQKSDAASKTATDAKAEADAIMTAVNNGQLLQALSLQAAQIQAGKK